MSLACKLDPTVRVRRTYRASLLRHPPPYVGPREGDGRILYIKVLGELALIAKSSRLTGQTKDLLFRRGVHQLRFQRLIA